MTDDNQDHLQKYVFRQVIPGKTQDTSLSCLIRAALKPWNTVKIDTEDELTDSA